MQLVPAELLQEGGGRGWLEVTTDTPHGLEAAWLRDPAPEVVRGARQPRVVTRCRTGDTGHWHLPCCRWREDGEVALGPGQQLATGRAQLLVTASDCRERRGLARRRLVRTLAPWTQENPIFFHMTNSSPPAVRLLLHQMADVGFEMMIFSFGSGFQMESRDPAYLASVRELVALGRSLGLEVGGYNLIALTRRVKAEWMAVNAERWPSACLASGWYDRLRNLTLGFLDSTGLTMVETDGPYGGYSCSAPDHAHHAGQADSVFHQNRLQAELYKELRNRGVYINQPDTYYTQVTGTRVAPGDT